MKANALASSFASWWNESRWPFQSHTIPLGCSLLLVSESSATGNPARYAITARAARCFALCCCGAMFSGIESTPYISLRRSLLFLDRCGLTPSSMSQGCDQGHTQVGLRQRCNFQIRVPCIACPMERTQNQKNLLATPFQYLFC